MPTTILCQKAKMGSTDYYIGTMKAGALVRSVGFVADLPEWDELTVDERIQREIDETRIKQEIVPYLQKDKDRFFGALIIDIYRGWDEMVFESLIDVAKVHSKAYEVGLKNVGYLHLPGADYLVALDGQHRLRALKYAIFGDGDTIKSNVELTNDDITVIFVLHTDNRKIRNIFNKVNRYARSTSRGDNIITSEDDAIAVLSRRLLKESQILSEENVNWKSNTLSQRSKKFTTISAIYDTIEIILDGHEELRMKHKVRPSDEDLDNYYEEVFLVWDSILNGVKLFENLHSDTVVKYRAKYLIFKPAGLTSMFLAVKMAIDSGYELSEVINGINNIDWNMKNDVWENIIIKPDGGIIAKKENRELVAKLILYMICKEKVNNGFKKKLARDFVSKKLGKENASNDIDNINKLDSFVTRAYLNIDKKI